MGTKYNNPRVAKATSQYTNILNQDRDSECEIRNISILIRRFRDSRVFIPIPIACPSGATLWATIERSFGTKIGEIA